MSHPSTRSAGFLRLWTATTAAGLATWSFPFVLGLAVARGDLGAAALGLLLAARTVGFLLAVPVGGVVADRWSRRAVVVVAAGAAAPATPLVVLAGSGSVTGLVAAALAAGVVGAGQGACRPAFQALVPDLVDPDDRRRANALISVPVRAGTMAGPALTAALAPALGTPGLLLVVAALWAAAAALVPGTWTRPASPGPTSVVAQLREGMQEARRHRWFLGGLGALTTVVLTGYSVTAVVLPAVSASDGGGVALLATATTAYTGGALLAAVLMTRWSPGSPGWVALAALALYAVAPLALSLASPGWAVVAAYLVAGLGVEVFNVLWFTAVQDQVPADRLARVSSLDFLVSYGLAPVGLALIAPLTAGVGTGPVLWVCAVACLAGPALAATCPGARRFTTPSTPAAQPVTLQGCGRRRR